MCGLVIDADFEDVFLATRQFNIVTKTNIRSKLSARSKEIFEDKKIDRSSSNVHLKECTSYNRKIHILKEKRNASSCYVDFTITPKAI